MVGKAVGGSGGDGSATVAVHDQRGIEPSAGTRLEPLVDTISRVSTIVVAAYRTTPFGWVV